MALEKCKHCSERVPVRRIKLHLKNCSGYRRFLKRKGFTKFVFPDEIAASIESNQEQVLTPEGENIEDQTGELLNEVTEEVSEDNAIEEVGQIAVLTPEEEKQAPKKKRRG